MTLNLDDKITLSTKELIKMIDYSYKNGYSDRDKFLYFETIPSAKRSFNSSKTKEIVRMLRINTSRKD